MPPVRTRPASPLARSTTGPGRPLGLRVRCERTWSVRFGSHATRPPPSTGRRRPAIISAPGSLSSLIPPTRRPEESTVSHDAVPFDAEPFEELLAAALAEAHRSGDAD